MEAYKQQLAQIFLHNKVLEVPFYQRKYVWGEDDWRRFLDDMVTMCQDDEPYFLGSLILKDKLIEGPNPEGFAGRSIVVDGQQRLTTLLILMKVIALLTNKEQEFERIFFIEGAETDETYIALRHNYNDRDAFEKVMRLSKLDDLSGNRIFDAYEFFKDNIDISDPRFQTLKLRTIERDLLFVGIYVGKDEDEQQIFDTINSLGVRLTTAELLKNYFFDEGTLHEFQTYWLPTFEKDDETKAYWDTEVKTGRITRTLIDNFLYSFLQIKIQDKSLGIPDEKMAPYQKYDRLFHSYQDFIANYYPGGKLNILPELMEYAALFRSAMRPEIVDEALPSEPGIERITAVMVGLDVNTMLPYVLYVLKNVPDRCERDAIFGILETYALRRVITHTPNKNYNRFFTETLIGNQVITADALKALFASMPADNVNAMPSDASLHQAFLEGHIWQWQATRVIYLIESALRDKDKNATTLNGISSYQLEHLMPVKWRQNWGQVADPDARDSALQTLGNFAILPAKLNASVSNADWSTKVAGKGDKGGLAKHAAGLVTLSPWLTSTTWDEQTIQNRGEWLYQKALKIWPSV